MSDETTPQPNNGHGGTRSGSGRKPNSEVYRQPIREVEQRIVERLLDIVDAQIDLALGITVQEVDEKTGGLKVYTRPPDHKAGVYLINRIAGVPTQRIEIDDVSQLSDEELEAIVTGSRSS